MTVRSFEQAENIKVYAAFTERMMELEATFTEKQAALFPFCDTRLYILLFQYTYILARI